MRICILITIIFSSFTLAKERLPVVSPYLYSEQSDYDISNLDNGDFKVYGFGTYAGFYLMPIFMLGVDLKLGIPKMSSSSEEIINRFDSPLANSFNAEIGIKTSIQFWRLLFQANYYPYSFLFSKDNDLNYQYTYMGTAYSYGIGFQINKYISIFGGISKKKYTHFSRDTEIQSEGVVYEKTTNNPRSTMRVDGQIFQLNFEFPLTILDKL